MITEYCYIKFLTGKYLIIANNFAWKRATKMKSKIKIHAEKNHKVNCFGNKI